MDNLKQGVFSRSRGGPVPGSGMDECDGPSCENEQRETAKMMLLRLIEIKKRDLVGLEQLLKVAEKCEDGSPLEEELCNLLLRRRSY
jgi:hypothetical protein